MLFYKIKNIHCVCKIKDDCLLKNCCQLKSVVYRCKVESEGKNYFYIGSTENYIKKWIVNHEYAFRNRNKSSYTSISKFILDLKNKIAK